MSDDERSPPSSLEDDLAAWGRVLTLETRGRRSGRLRRVTVGFVEEDGGSLLVAASKETTGWARNLLADPRCSVEISGGRSERQANQLGDQERHAAVAALILKYGTPSERLGSGPAFRLVPLASRT